jgi:trans-2,3-dihydro-3-hydroxyanthranilate isomerase
MRSYDYQTVDVFTDQRFGGNPLAVILDDAGLSTEEMQAIAREFNYSETTFVGPPADPANTARVRIFTPAAELPFAGHPNVGTAYVLANLPAYRQAAATGAFRFEEKAGLVNIALRRDGGAVMGATIQAPKPLAVGRPVDAADIAAAVGLSAADVVLERHAPPVASVGLDFIFAELASVEALSRCQPDIAAFRAASQRHDDVADRFSLFVYARVAGEAATLRARMFAPLSHTPEDPATGSASATLGALLASLDPRADGEIAHVIHQGVEMGRPSRLEVSATKAAGAVTVARVGGGCVPVMKGVLSL